MVKENTCKSVTKSLLFEKNGATIYVTIGVENVSPHNSKDFIISLMNTLFEEAKNAFT